MKPTLERRLGDPIADQVRRSHAAAIAELQASPFAEPGYIPDVQLANGVPTAIAHGLGRTPKLVLVSPVRGAASSGRIEEIRDANDRTQVVVLKATGYGATVTVDVGVV